MNVLIPTDFSDTAWNATAYALHFFRGQQVKLYLLHVDVRTEAVAGPSIFGTEMPVATRKVAPRITLRYLQEKIEASFPHHNFTIETLVENNLFIKGIRKVVEDKQIDLLFMGTKGATGIKQRTLGSNAGDVITKVKCPALIIPHTARFVVPEKIAFPTDFNLIYKERIVRTLRNFAQRHDSFLEVVYVSGGHEKLNQVQAKNKEFLTESLDAVQHTFSVCHHPNIELGLQHFVEEKSIDIVMMVAKNLNFFQRLLFKPTLKRIRFHTEIPFLVLHE